MSFKKLTKQSLRQARAKHQRAKKRRLNALLTEFSDWKPMIQLQRFVYHPRRKGSMLAIQMTCVHDSWGVLALETVHPSTIKGSGVRAGVDAVLDNHSHQFIGDFDLLADAIDAAEAYGHKWRTDALAKHEKCECGPIEGTGALMAPAKRTLARLNKDVKRLVRAAKQRGAS